MDASQSPQMKICAQRSTDVGAITEAEGRSERMERIVRPGRSYSIEIAHGSIGVHNEYFLYHRRSGRYRRYCWLPGFARLNVE